MSTDISTIAIKTHLENERRDVKDLWNDALRSYQGIVGEQLCPVYTNVDDMVKSGIDQMNAFHKWRHNDTKVDKLRSLFMANIGHIEKGAQKLIAAAEPAFPPAAAIGTAVTFILAACRSVSADYDVITAFFEDMNSFLQRVSILEARLPAYRAYQACLMDVFTSLLKMCAFARKFIQLGRLKKWIINAFRGEDGELAGSRKSMDTALIRLQSATEFAILANTENLVSGQQILRSMQEELKSNQMMQYELAQNQQLMLQEVIENQADVKDELGDIKKLVQALQKGGDSPEDTQSRTKSATNPIRSVIGEVPENDHQLQMLLDSHLPGTSSWIFEEPKWKSWFQENTTAPLLLLKGAEGVGKSHLAMSALKHIEREVHQDPGNFSCVVYFFAQESIASLKKFHSIINCAILQVSEQNINLRDQLNAQLSQGSVLKTNDYLEHLLMPMFGPTSKHQLYLIVDAVDALETNHDRDSIFQLAETIRKSNLRIKTLATGRPHVKPSKFHELGQSEWSGSNEIWINKDKFTPDLKLIAQNHLQSSDSAFRGLRYLRQDIKDEIIDALQTKADGLLYAHEALLYMSNLGREPAIRTLLSTSMPITVLGWFYRLIDKCERRTPADLRGPVQTLITWLLCAFDSLAVGSINDLLRLDSGKKDIEVEDEILDIYKDFLRMSISPSGKKAHKSFHLPTTHDANAHLNFRERAMSTFFLKRQSRLKDVRISVMVSHGHRTLFLLCCRVIQEYQVPGTTSSESFQGLHRYALRYCLRHLRRITSDMHTEEENAQVCEALSTLLTNRSGFAKQIENAGPGFTIADLINFNKNSLNVDWDRVFLEGWDMWSNWVKEVSNDPKSQLTPVTLQYLLKDRTQVLLPLAEAHLQNFLLATDPVKAIISYRFGRKTVRKTCKRVLLCEQISDEVLDRKYESEGYEDRSFDPILWHNEVLRLRRINYTQFDSNAHFVTAVLSNLVRGNEQYVITELETAIEKSKSTDDEVRYLVFLSKVYFLRLGQLEQSLSYLDFALEKRSEIPQELTLLALEVKASVLAQSQQVLQALSIYRELHTLNTDEVISSRLLLEEFNLYIKSGDASKILNHIEGLDPTQRLNLVLEQAFWTTPSYGWSIHFALLEAALAVDRIPDLLRVYISIGASLEMYDMSPIWSPFIAHTYWTADKDIDAAKATLNKALSSPCYVQEYPLIGVDTSLLAMRNVNMLSDILLEQFQLSGDPEAKSDLFEAASKLMQKELPQSVQINDASVIPHSLVVATMTRKVGSAKEYEKNLRQVFDICWANLHDTVSWNDANSICNLSRVLAQMPEMRREAEVLHSAQLYHLGSESMFLAFCTSEGLKMDATSVIQYEAQFANSSAQVPKIFAELSQIYDRYAMANPGGWNLYSFLVKHGGSTARQWSSPTCTRAHICKDQERSSWSDGPLYTCLYCTDCRLCQTCYDFRTRHDGAGEPVQDHSFCCDNGQYLRTPVPGWLGIKNETIYIEGEVPITMDQFLDNVRVKWNACWDQFWRG